MQSQETIIPGQDYLDGQILVFDKPYKWTSFDLVKKGKLIWFAVYCLVIGLVAIGIGLIK